MKNEYEIIQPKIIERKTIKMIDNAKRIVIPKQIVKHLELNNSNDFFSDRGYYRYMALKICKETNESIVSTVGDFLSLLNKALSKGNMVGYKGGDFEINNDTILVLNYNYNSSEGFDIKYF